MNAILIDSHLRSLYTHPVAPCKEQKKCLASIECSKKPDAAFFFHTVANSEDRTWVKTHGHFITKYLKKITKFAAPCIIDVVYCLQVFHLDKLETFQDYSNESLGGIVTFLIDQSLPELSNKALFNITIIACHWRLESLFKACLEEIEKKNLETDFKARASKLGPKAMRKVANMYLTFYDKSSTSRSVFSSLFTPNMIDFLLQKKICKETGFLPWILERYSSAFLVSKEGTLLIEHLAEKHSLEILNYQKELSQLVPHLADSVIDHGRLHATLFFLINAGKSIQHFKDQIAKIAQSTSFQSQHRESIFLELHKQGYFNSFVEQSYTPILLNALESQDSKFITFLLDFLICKCQMTRLLIVKILNQGLPSLLAQIQPHTLCAIIDFLQRDIHIRNKINKRSELIDVLILTYTQQCDLKTMTILLKYVSNISKASIEACIQLPIYDTKILQLIFSKTELTGSDIIALAFQKALTGEQIDQLFALYQPQQISEIVLGAAKILTQKKPLTAYKKLYEYTKKKGLSIPYNEKAKDCHPLKNRLIHSK